jgi:hypothetical protein
VAVQDSNKSMPRAWRQRYVFLFPTRKGEQQQQQQHAAGLVLAGKFDMSQFWRCTTTTTTTTSRPP